MPVVYIVEAYMVLPMLTLTWYMLFASQEMANALLNKIAKETNNKAVVLDNGELHIYEGSTHIRTYRVVETTVQVEEYTC